MKKLLKNGNVFVSKNKKFEICDILLEDDKIKEIGKELSDSEAETIDCNGYHILPGLIDMHVHLRDPGYTAKEDIISGAKAAAKGGFSSICCMPNTNPVLDNTSAINYVTRKAGDLDKTRIFVIGAMSKGLEGKEIANIGSMVNAGVIGISDDGNCIQNTKVALNVVRYASTYDLPIIVHAEDYTLSGEGQVNYGKMSTKLGVKGIPSLSEEIIVSREIMLANVTNSHIHFSHVSTHRAVELIRRAKADGVNITAEVTPHHLLLTEEECAEFDTNKKMKPPLRTEKDRQALISGLQDGTIDVIATDHAPHTDYEKELEFLKAPFGVIGLESAFPALYTNLVKNGEFQLEELVAKMSENPAQIIKQDLGLIAEGKTADLAVVNLDESFLFSENYIASKSHNSPFLGKTFFGKPKFTLCKGKIIWQD
ncbi:MAG: dihydroorotase [Candidatus Cloacimonetes bacterium]|nr:dihydroorotase [Candidatus Cloacimonadota bacterium]MBS3767915.1 dihydroorotase [Candidatus Cloacimonadota bacterium]